MTKFVYWLLNSLAFLLRRLPISVRFRIGDAIGVLWFDVLRLRRRVALENLDIAFPNKSEKEKIKIARASLCHLGRSIVEIFMMAGANPDEIKEGFEIVGKEHLDQALAKQKGVFLLTSHLGNGDWATLGLAGQNIHVHIITKEIKNRWVNNLWFYARKNRATDYIPDRQSSLMILKLLKKNNTIVFMLDQFLGPPIGIRTHFFGKETGTPMGLALLAGRSGAVVIPCYTLRTSQGVTRIVFEKEIPFVESANKEETIKNMTQTYCYKIEEWVRHFPEQWMWVHRRWKKYKY